MTTNTNLIRKNTRYRNVEDLQRHYQDNLG